MRRNIDARCKSKTKAGKPCRAAATEGGLCFFHANPNKAAELGRIGGKSRLTSFDRDVDPLPSLDNARAVRDTVARLICDVFDGKLHPRVAAGLAPLMHLQLRAIETAGFEERIAKLEKRMARLQAEEDAKPDRAELASHPPPAVPLQPEDNFSWNDDDAVQPERDL